MTGTGERCRGRSARRAFRAMSTSWWIACDRPDLLRAAEARVHATEARLSRFRADSALSRLNRARAVVDPLLAEVTRAALRLRAQTDGAFTPTLGARLAGLGYDRSFDLLPVRTTAVPPPDDRPIDPLHDPLQVEVEGERVRLHGPGDLDLGGVAKGWTVDHVLEALREGGAGRALVDGGGDLRGFGRRWPVGVGDDLVASVEEEAVATSSTRRRRWRGARGEDLHHLLDPRTGAPARSSVDTATVVAPDAATADALATAVVVDPGRVLPLLPGLGARAAVRGLDGRWWTTPGWEATP